MDRNSAGCRNRPTTRASLSPRMKHTKTMELPRGGSLASSNANPSTSATTSGELASLFECPVCYQHIMGPINQCHNGHLVCQKCRPMLQCCPTCRGPLSNIRNLAMEKVARTVNFPCKFASSGCKLTFLHSEKIEHEELCELRPYLCPCPGAPCKWEGSLEQVMPHLIKNHKITSLQGEDIVFLATDILLCNISTPVHWVMIQKCHNQDFMVVLFKKEKIDHYQQYFAIVQLIGSRRGAKAFSYRLELNGTKHHLTWEATPRSIHDSIPSVILESDCLVFDTSMAKLFSINGNLSINVTITVV